MVEPMMETKIVLLGDTGVGKTAIAQRFVQEKFDGGTESTVGASYFSKRFTIDDIVLRLQIWDTAGQERFKALAPMYYHGASGALLVYNSTIPKTLEKVKDWAKELAINVPDDIVISVVGSKTDLLPTQTNHQELEQLSADAKEYASSINAIFAETSAKAGTGINELFTALVREIVKRHKPSTPDPNVINVASTHTTSGQKTNNGGCC
ncbi:GTP-binding protein rab11 [Pelomyxa schiedti]|nr:GTP-binding protein rab11 [Pelomyxa schiedti]